MIRAIQSAVAAAVVLLIVVAAAASIGSREAKAAPGNNPPGQTTLVQNPATNPVPIYAAPQPFKMILAYNQQDGTFPKYAVPANQRIIVRQINVGVLVPTGMAPVASIHVAPTAAPNLGTYLGHPVMTYISRLQTVQDRYAASDGTFVILEAGETLDWFIADAAGEGVFTPSSVLNAFISLSGEVISLAP